MIARPGRVVIYLVFLFSLILCASQFNETLLHLPSTDDSSASPIEPRDDLARKKEEARRKKQEAVLTSNEKKDKEKQEENMKPTPIGRTMSMDINMHTGQMSDAINGAPSPLPTVTTYIYPPSITPIQWRTTSQSVAITTLLLIEQGELLVVCGNADGVMYVIRAFNGDMLSMALDPVASGLVHRLDGIVAMTGTKDGTIVITIDTHGTLRRWDLLNRALCGISYTECVDTNTYMALEICSDGSTFMMLTDSGWSIWKIQRIRMKGSIVELINNELKNNSSILNTVDKKEGGRERSNSISANALLSGATTFNLNRASSRVGDRPSISQSTPTLPPSDPATLPTDSKLIGARIGSDESDSIVVSLNLAGHYGGEEDDSSSSSEEEEKSNAAKKDSNSEMTITVDESALREALETRQQNEEQEDTNADAFLRTAGNEVEEDEDDS